MLSLDPSKHGLDEALNCVWIVAYGVDKLL